MPRKAQTHVRLYDQNGFVSSMDIDEPVFFVAKELYKMHNNIFCYDCQEPVKGTSDPTNRLCDACYQHMLDERKMVHQHDISAVN